MSPQLLPDMDISANLNSTFLEALLEGTPDFIATDSRTIKTVLQHHLDANKQSSDYAVFSSVLRLTVEELVENPRFYGRFGGRIFFRPTIVVETGLLESHGCVMMHRGGWSNQVDLSR